MKELEANTLVRITGSPELGIGCIAKVFKNQYNVNVGSYDCKKISKKNVVPVDVSKTKTVTFYEFQSRILSDKSTLDDVIVGNELKHYVGIGWVTTRVVKENDLLKYPRVI